MTGGTADPTTGPATGPTGARPRPGGSLQVLAPAGIGEVVAGTDLAALVLRAVDLGDGDVLVVTSKAVSKAEGRVVTGTREDAVAGQTVRVVARRGPTSIVENPLGLVMAAAGVDASNVTPGSLVLLPLDPDASARTLRDRVHAAVGRNVAVVVTDTAGRAWRTGQVDIAVGVAGLAPLESFAGRVDAYGNPLAVTEPAVADELASAAELATGKLSGRPVAVVRGLADRVLPAGEQGPGAGALLRPREQDMFALGSREAVIAAVAGTDADCFGSPATAAELVTALAHCRITAEEAAPDRVRTGPLDAPGAARAAVVAFAHRWRPDPTSSADRPEYRPSTP